jgi:serine/threonine protein kinase
LALTPGTRFGAYDILTPLGAGGMGEVFQAKDTRLKRDVALKVLPDRVAQAADRIARFQREAELLASLNHPNIAGIYGIEESNGVRALVLELVEGPTLADRVAKGPIPLDETLAIARQIADALDAAHERGIVHRDLKPANIKITPGGIVKVLDFGLAKVQRADGSAVPTLAPTISVDGTSDGIVLGTAAYMSPEQARGHAVDKRTDMWAFGCVLYEMLTGRVAFKATTLSDTLVCVLERDPDWTALPATAPPGAHRLMRRCLEKDSRRRLATSVTYDSNWNRCNTPARGEHRRRQVRAPQLRCCRSQI